MQKIDLKKEFKKITTIKGGDPLKMEITPFRDWRIVVVVFFVGLAVSFGFNVYMSIEVNRDTFFAAIPKATGVLKFEEEGLAKTVVDIDGKAIRFEKAKKDVMTVVDPSL